MRPVSLLLCIVGGVAAGVLVTATAAAKTWIVCAAATPRTDCSFSGNNAIQAAVDAAASGDTIHVTSGLYVPERTRDVTFNDDGDDVVIRAYIAIESKQLTLDGEPGVVLDGKRGVPAAAMAIKGSDVAIRQFIIRDFRYAQKEDSVYDGHGTYIIDSAATLSDISMERFQKMGLSARGSSTVSATGMRIVDGHVGVFVRETAKLRLCNSFIGRNQAGIGANAQGSARVYNSVIQGNTDDGLGFDGDSMLFVTNSIIANNKPFGVNALARARITVQHSVLFGNQLATNVPIDPTQLKLDRILTRDLQLSVEGQVPAAIAATLQGDPAVRVKGARAAVARIGLQDVESCPRADFAGNTPAAGQRSHQR